MDIVKSFLGDSRPDDAQDPKNDHQHQWELLMRTYSPPRAGNIPDNTPEDILQKALFGFTTLFWECSMGKEHKKEEVLGSDHPQLDELVQKVDQFGPQYFQRNGSNYAIAKTQPQNLGVPVR